MPPPGCVLPRCPPPRRRTAPSRRGIGRNASSTSSPRYWFGRAYRPKQLAVGGQLLHVHCVLDRRCGARRWDYRQRVVADSGLVAEAGLARGDRGRAPSRRRRRLTARTEEIHETGQGGASVEVVETRCTTAGIAITTGNPPYSIRPYCRAAGASRSEWCGRGDALAAHRSRCRRGEGPIAGMIVGLINWRVPARLRGKVVFAEACDRRGCVSVPIGRRAWHRSEPRPGAAGGSRVRWRGGRPAD